MRQTVLYGLTHYPWHNTTQNNYPILSLIGLILKYSGDAEFITEPYGSPGLPDTNTSEISLSSFTRSICGVQYVVFSFIMLIILKIVNY